MAFKRKEDTRPQKGADVFLDRGNPGWEGPLIDYKEVELLRKLTTSSSKVMSRKRAGTSTKEQEAVKRAVKYARYMALMPYRGF